MGRAKVRIIAEGLVSAQSAGTPLIGFPLFQKDLLRLGIRHKRCFIVHVGISFRLYALIIAQKPENSTLQSGNNSKNRHISCGLDGKQDARKAPVPAWFSRQTAQELPPCGTAPCCGGDHRISHTPKGFFCLRQKRRLFIPRFLFSLSVSRRTGRCCRRS